MYLEFLGHSGLIVEHEGARVACDPWLSPLGAYDASWFQFPRNHHLFARDYSDLRAVVLSHEHLDHLDPDFLSSRVPMAAPIVVPRYPSRNLVRKVARACANRIVEIDPGTEHRIEGTDIRVLFTSEESPANQDSAITFVAGDHVVLNLNDARLSPKQRAQLKQRFGTIDAILLQCAGASWYPLCYRYPPARLRELAAEKRKAKLEYAYQTLAHLEPRVGLPYAGPAAFLDAELFRHNLELGDAGIFPDQRESETWLRARGYAGRLELPLPGDRLDVASGRFEADPRIQRDFSFDRKADDLARYAEDLRPAIARHVASLPSPAESLLPAFAEHFTRLGRMSAYFRTRIDMDLRFVVAGPHGGDWLVRCHPEGVEVEPTRGRPAQYTLAFDEIWLHRILSGELAWEDFFLSLRFSAERSPDVYNDHLLSWLKFADEEALGAVERYECSQKQGELIVVEAAGRKYRIAKYCPHAGASLEDAVIEGTTITCLNHHYRFDLETGKCLNGNCTLFTRRVD